MVSQGQRRPRFHKRRCTAVDSGHRAKIHLQSTLLHRTIKRPLSSTVRPSLRPPKKIDLRTHRRMTPIHIPPTKPKPSQPLAISIPRSQLLIAVSITKPCWTLCPLPRTVVLLLIEILPYCQPSLLMRTPLLPHRRSQRLQICLLDLPHKKNLPRIRTITQTLTSGLITHIARSHLIPQPVALTNYSP